MLLSYSTPTAAPASISPEFYFNLKRDRARHRLDELRDKCRQEHSALLAEVRSHAVADSVLLSNLLLDEIERTVHQWGRDAEAAFAIAADKLTAVDRLLRCKEDDNGADPWWHVETVRAEVYSGCDAHIPKRFFEFHAWEADRLFQKYEEQLQNAERDFPELEKLARASDEAQLRAGNDPRLPDLYSLHLDKRYLEGARSFSESVENFIKESRDYIAQHRNLISEKREFLEAAAGRPRAAAKAEKTLHSKIEPRRDDSQKCNSPNTPNALIKNDKDPEKARSATAHPVKARSALPSRSDSVIIDDDAEAVASEASAGELTLEQYEAKLRYRPHTGEHIWVVSGSGVKCGAVAGSKTEDGYVQITLYGKKYYAHRLAFLAHDGKFPPADMEVHHKNEIRSDNRFENLELLTKAENLARRNYSQSSGDQS